MNTTDYAFYVAKITPLQWQSSAAMLASMGGFVPAYRHPSTDTLRPLYGALGFVPLPNHPAKRKPTSDALMALKRLRYVNGILGYNADTGFAPSLPSSFVPELLRSQGSNGSGAPANGVVVLSLCSSDAVGDDVCVCECHVAQRRLKLRARSVGDTPRWGSQSKGGSHPARILQDLQRLANNRCDCCPHARNRVPEFLPNQALKIHGLQGTEATYCKHTASTVTVELCLLGRPHRVTLGLGQVYT